jgi:hypothetical protein
MRMVGPGDVAYCATKKPVFRKATDGRHAYSNARTRRSECPRGFSDNRPQPVSALPPKVLKSALC